MGGKAAECWGGGTDCTGQTRRRNSHIGQVAPTGNGGWRQRGEVVEVLGRLEVGKVTCGGSRCECGHRSSAEGRV